VRRANGAAFLITDEDQADQEPTTVTLDHVNSEDWAFGGNVLIHGKTGGTIIKNSILEGAARPSGANEVDNVRIEVGTQGSPLGVLLDGVHFETVATSLAFTRHVHVASGTVSESIRIINCEFGGVPILYDVHLESGDFFLISGNRFLSQPASGDSFENTSLAARIAAGRVLMFGNYGPTYTDPPLRMWKDRVESQNSVGAAPSINILAYRSDRFVIANQTDGQALTVNSPLTANNYTPNMTEIAITIRDDAPSGSGLASITMASGYRLAGGGSTIPVPGRTKQTTVRFQYWSANGLWHETSRAAAVPSF
jgi:hypothetical protein